MNCLALHSKPVYYRRVLPAEKANNLSSIQKETVNMPHQSAEKRKYLRIDTNDIVQCLDESGSGPDRQVRSKNISAGGILIETRTEHAIGETLRIEISLSGFSKYRNGLFSFLKRRDDSLSVTGKVVRLEKVSDDIFFIGLCFTDMSSHDRNAIEKYIREHLDR
jgi:hypothetical protein